MAEFTSLKNKIQDFRSTVRKSMRLTKDEEKFLFSIPEEVWQRVFKNFKENAEYARRVILDRRDIIENLDEKEIDKQRENIDNLQYASKTFNEFVKNKSPILFITDYDNDGSLSQSVINQYIEIENNALEDTSNIYVEYARTVEGNNSRGLTLELVDDLVKEKSINANQPFLLVTADNGINSLAEQKRIQQKYPQLKLIITDHHEPENGMLIEENDQTIIVNPKYRASQHQSQEMFKDRENEGKNPEFFEKYNISGATVVGVLLKKALQEKYQNKEVLDTEYYKKGIYKINQLSKASNILDYVDTAPEDKLYNLNDIQQFVAVQSLLNVNNSMAKIIGVDINSFKEINQLKKAIPEIEQKTIKEVMDNVFILNKYAQVVLTIIKKLESDKKEAIKNEEKKELLIEKNKEGFNKAFLETLSKLEWLDKNSFKNENIQEALQTLEQNLEYLISLEDEVEEDRKPEYEREIKEKAEIVEEMKSYIKKYPFELFSSNNKNYIEQLRPYIFSYIVNEDKNAFEKEALTQALKIFNGLKKQENLLMKELRKFTVSKNIENENVNIALLSPEVSELFNRKLINKTYNGSNNGFHLILDNVEKTKIAGSFRSLYDIDLLVETKEFKDFCQKEQIRIETPGHKRAAGFILTKLDGGEIKNAEKILEQVADIFNQTIENIKKNDLDNKNQESYIVSDVYNLGFINKFNETVRGNIPHYECVSPLVKLHKDFVYVDQKTNRQKTLKEYVEENKYGYCSILIELPKQGVSDKNMIIPVELLRKVVNSGEDENGFYNDFVKLSYLDDGVFMVSNLVEKDKVDLTKVIEFKQEQSHQEKVNKAFKEKKIEKPVQYTREELKKSPFFKANKYGEHDFSIFENMIVKIIDSSAKDGYVTFDVEANGFSNAKMFNIGIAHYEIEPTSIKEIDKKTFKENVFFSINNGSFLVNEVDKLKEITKEEYHKLLKEDKLDNVLFKNNNQYYLYDGEKVKIQNFTVSKDNPDIIQYNRQIKCTTLSRLIKEEDFKLPIYMTYLTGVTNEHLDKYGKSIKEVDEFFTNYLKGKDIIIGAHNTPYDNRIARANMPTFFEEVIAKSKQFDTARFSRNNLLAYDNTSVAQFINVPEVPENVYFYNNLFSKLNIYSFLKGKEGQFPDRTGDYRFSFENDELYFITDKVDKYEKVKVSVPYEDLLMHHKEEEKIENVTENLEEILTDGKNKKPTKKKKETVKEKTGFELFEETRIDRDFEWSINGKLRTILEIPLNSVRFSAQAIGNQQMIRNLMLDEQDFDVKIITDLSKYGDLVKKHEIKLLELMKTYRFDKTFKENLKDQHLTNLYTYDRGIVDLEKDFLTLNKELSACFNDNWYYKAILTIKDPTFKDLNEETYDVVSMQSGINKEIVKEVLQKAYNFKKKYGLKDIIQKELHVNGVENGDVLYETPITIVGLANKTMTHSINSLSLQLTNPLNIFIEEAENFTLQTRLNERNKIISDDSMGAMQLVDFKREGKSELAKERELRDKHMNSEFTEMVVNFGLGSNVLQPGSNLMAIKKEGVELSLEQIREDAKKFAFIMKHNQTCVGNIGAKLLEDNVDLIKKYKKDLAKRYRYAELNTQTKEAENLDKVIYGSENWDLKLEKTLTKRLTDADSLPLAYLEAKMEELENQIKNERAKDEENQRRNKIEKWQHTKIAIKNEIDYRKENDIQTSLEREFYSDKPENKMEKEYCLTEQVRRLKPLQHLLTHFDLLEMTQEYMRRKYVNQDLSLDIEQILDNSNKKSKKRTNHP